jgi:methyl-accepting chemotaxis protein
MLSLENKIKRFSEDAYKMETTAMGAEVALMNMQNNIYKAMQTDKENVSITLAGKAEEEYVHMLTHLEEIYNSETSVKSVTTEMKEELQNELKKAERYHKKFTECINKKDVEGAFKIYKNDYAPILASISTVLNSIYTSASQYASMYVAKSNIQTIISIIFFFVLMVLGMISSFFMAKTTTKSIVEPIHEIEEAVMELSRGNLNISLEYHSEEELGSLSHAVRKTKEILKDYIENITDVLQRLEKKDMKVKVTTDYIGSFAPIKDSLQEIIHFYHEMTEVLKNTSSEVSSGAGQLADLSQAITKDANTQTESIQALVEQVITISNEVEINAENISKAQVLSQNTMSTAEQGNQHMILLSKAVEDIIQHSKEIASINQLIKNIAEQTHLLSLNASIEAARAGVNGYGFAVVAEEIRKLSDQTKEASHTVNSLIESSLGSIEQGNKITIQTATNLQDVEKYSAQTYGLIESVSTVSQDQTEKLKEALNFLREIAGIANENLAVAEESYATSTEFLGQADILGDKLKEFVV